MNKKEQTGNQFSVKRANHSHTFTNDGMNATHTENGENW